jgi:predicted nucleotidyltransferase
MTTELKIILRAVVGSTVHGTNVAQQDDRDEMAIAIEPPRLVFGLTHWETTVERTQPEGVRSGPGDLDLVIHSLRKYCRLAAKGNPTMLLPLFVPEDAIVEITDTGRSLMNCRNMFLSRDCGKAFLGYMIAQKSRLEGTQGGRHGSRPELVEKYGFDTKYAGHVIRLGYQGLELMQTGKLSLPMAAHHSADVRSIRTGGWTLDGVLNLAGELERDLRDSLDTGFLPEHADEQAINCFCSNAYLKEWGY